MRRWLFFISLVLVPAIGYRIIFINNKSTVTISPISISSTPSVPTNTNTPVPPKLTTIGLVGDLGLGRHITSTARLKNDFSWSFESINPWLLANDFTLANLESPVIKNCPNGVTGTFTFCGDERFVPELYSREFILNLNNNHILNYGRDGLIATRSFLPDISFYDDLFIKKIDDISIGFLGYDFITNPQLDKEKILKKISESKTKVDFLIVSIHWGNEYLPKPEKWRVDLAHQMVVAGADIIHGHHPHVWQGAERYQQGLIFYSLGNFVFDQSWSYETSHSQIARVKVQIGEPLKYDLFPIEIKFNSQPNLMPSSLQVPSQL